MRVFLDPEIFFLQYRGGISTYFSRLVAEFIADPSRGVSVEGLPRFAKAESLIAAGLSRATPHRALSRTPILTLLDSPNALTHRWNADIVHSTYYERPHLRRRGEQRLAVTVHDMTPEFYPEHFASGNPHRHKLSHIREADLIFCVSETTCNDLYELAPGTRGKVVHTPLGTGWPFTGDAVSLEPSAHTMVGYPYVLFVGSRSPYKAFDVLVEALGHVRRRGEDIGLVVVGGTSLTSVEKRMLSSSAIPEERFARLTPDDTGLAALYRAALLFSYPSDYEGFGLPLIDALASGCIAVTSDAPALVEVGGGVAIVHPRRDPEALAAAIREVVTAPTCLTELRREEGREHASRYTWARTAQLTAEGYRLVL